MTGISMDGTLKLICLNLMVIFHYLINYFLDKWYVSKDTPDHDSVKGDSIRGSGFSKIKDTILYFNIADHIKSLAKANSCLIRAVAM